MSEDLKELRRLAEAATPGPWIAAERPKPSLVDHGLRVVAERGSRYGLCVFAERDRMVQEGKGCVWGEDMAFIAAANPATVLRLLDHIAELEAMVPRWIPVAERLPDAGVIGMAFYRNELGKCRIIRAAYYPKFTHEANLDYDDLDTEYDEASDAYYWPEGWYEQIDNWDDYGSVMVQRAVTHWQPLPPPPTGDRS